MTRRNSSESSTQTSRPDPQAEVESQNQLPRIDYFPLAPMTAIAMLWWVVIDASPSMTGVIVMTALAVGIAFAAYLWLCGSFQRALLLSIGLGLVFYAVIWRVSQFKDFSLVAYAAVLAVLWLILKFGGRVHVRTRKLEPDEIPFRSRASREFSGRIGNARLSADPTSVVEEVWTTVSTVFRPRYPRAWSAEMRTTRHWQATLGGFALIACGLLATQTRGLGFAAIGIWSDRMAIAILLVATGWSLVGIAYELRRADRASQVVSDTRDSNARREPRL